MIIVFDVNSWFYLCLTSDFNETTCFESVFDDLDRTLSGEYNDSKSIQEGIEIIISNIIMYFYNFYQLFKCMIYLRYNYFLNFLIYLHINDHDFYHRKQQLDNKYQLKQI